VVSAGGGMVGGREVRVVRRSSIDWSVLQPGERMHHNRLHMQRGGLRFVRAFRGGCIFYLFSSQGRATFFYWAQARAHVEVWRCLCAECSCDDNVQGSAT